MILVGRLDDTHRRIDPNDVPERAEHSFSTAPRILVSFGRGPTAQFLNVKEFLYPSQAKTVARGVFTLSDTATTMPHTLRRVDAGDEISAELGVLIGFDDDLAGEATRISNRIRGLLTGIHPALERVLAPRISHPAVLEILTRCGGPNGIRNAGKRMLTNLAVKHVPRTGTRLADEIIAALSTRTVTVPGSKAAEVVLPNLRNP